MEQVELLLRSKLHQDNWLISKPRSGKSKESFIAENNSEKVFVKLDVSKRSINALKTLSELNIAPQVVASGEQNGTRFLIQEYVDGTHPNRNWFKDNIRTIARIIKSYHSSENLTQELTEDQSQTDEAYLNNAVNFLQKYLDMVNLSEVDKGEISNQIKQLRIYISSLPQTKLVPTHADPNPANFIIAQDKVFMVDWDDLTLSDEMRDISLLLGKYVPTESWNDFFDEYGVSFDQVKERFYWWLAHGSLVIALWFAQRNEEESTKDYLNDFSNALNKFASK